MPVRFSSFGWGYISVRCAPRGFADVALPSSEDALLDAELLLPLAQTADMDVPLHSGAYRYCFSLDFCDDYSLAISKGDRRRVDATLAYHTSRARARRDQSALLPCGSFAPTYATYIRMFPTRARGPSKTSGSAVDFQNPAWPAERGRRCRSGHAHNLIYVLYFAASRLKACCWSRQSHGAGYIVTLGAQAGALTDLPLQFRVLKPFAGVQINSLLALGMHGDS